MTKDTVQESDSREAIAKHFLGKAKEELIRFDLERFKTLYFRNVHTYSKEEFKAYWEKNKPVAMSVH